MKKREKFLIVMLISAVGASAYYQILYKPLLGNIRAYASQKEKLKTQMQDTRVHYPEIDEKKYIKLI